MKEREVFGHIFRINVLLSFCIEDFSLFWDFLSCRIIVAYKFGHSIAELVGCWLLPSEALGVFT
jgi:hypothetical protein